MKPEEIEIYAEFMKKYGLEYLEVKKGDFHLILSKKGERINEIERPIEEKAKVDLDEIIKKAKQQEQELENLVYVKSPLVGTFYRASSPSSVPFVEVGQKVKKGDILCIVEAMKVMNEIKSEHDGIVEKILVENGKPVEYGQVLFILRTVLQINEKEN